MTQVLLARRRAARAVEHLTGQTGLLRLHDVLEHVALREHLCARVRFERVLAVRVEVVVHGVQEGVAADLGGAAGSVVDVVLLEGDQIVAAGQVDAPVVVAVAGRGPAGGAVDLAVGDCDAVGGRVAEHNVLARDQICGDVVDPDEVCAVDGDGITAPDVFRIDIGEAYVLDDYVLCVTDDADSLALNDALGALADEGLVGSDGHAEHAGFVVRDAVDFGRGGLVVDAPVVLVDGLLTLRAGAPGGAAGAGDGSFGAVEVEGLGQDDDAGGGVAEVADELGGGSWVDWCGIATTGYAWYVLVIEIVNVPLRMDVPFANPSAAPLTPSAAETLEMNAATAATKTVDLILSV
jgi:hypothetical protein